MTVSKTDSLTCLDGGPRHSFESAGLDVVRGELRAVKQCVWCPAIRTSAPRAHPQRQYFTTRAIRKADR